MQSAFQTFGINHPRYTPLSVVPDARIVEVGIRRFADDSSDVAWLAGDKDRSARTLGDGYSFVTYDLEALLTQILYGRSAAAGIPAFHDRVLFTYVRRCVEALGGNDDTVCPSIINTNGASYPDVPTNLYCTSTTFCGKDPSFFHTRRLSMITTSTSVDGITWTTAREWRPQMDFPDLGDGSNEKLWLASMGVVQPSCNPAAPPATWPPTRWRCC